MPVIEAGSHFWPWLESPRTLEGRLARGVGRTSGVALTVSWNSSAKGSICL